MAENSSSSPLPPPTSGDQIPPNPNPSPPIPPSPSSSLDLPQISSPHALQRSGSISRLTQLQQQQQQIAAAAAMRQYGGGGKLSFGGPQIRPGQQLPGGQGPAHFNLPRQKAQLQAMGMMNSMGVNVNAQLRGNGSLSYAQQQQQRFSNQVQMRQQQLLPQTSLPSPQKLPGPSLSRSSSLASVNPQLSGLSPNGQSVLMQSTLAQQQWLKQMQPTMPATVPPSYSLQQQQQQRQQQAFLSQQLSSSQLHQKSMGLSQQQISQLLQHQSQFATSQQHLHQQQLQQLQQFQQQQQQSPRFAGTAAQQSLSLTGSEPDTPASGATTIGGSAGTETGSRLLGKRKIQDLVSQVDSLGKLDPEVEDLLLEIADDFIDSVTTFACSLAKHRKSSTLDSKDLLLHLEKNWHLKIPGYSREEQKNQAISLPTDVHAKRLEVVRAVMDSQQLERDKSGATKGTVKQNISSSVVDRPIKPSPSSEHLVLHSAASQMMHKIPRF